MLTAPDNQIGILPQFALRCLADAWMLDCRYINSVMIGVPISICFKCIASNGYMVYKLITFILLYPFQLMLCS